MKNTIALLALILASACATTSAARNGTSPVALGETAQVGPLRVTPEEVIEDSRCPENARCIWAGRAIVRTQVIGEGVDESVLLQLGEPHAIAGGSLALTSAVPEKRADRETAPEEYRFGFEWRPLG